jgi:hypothetical protein
MIVSVAREILSHTAKVLPIIRERDAAYRLAAAAGDPAAKAHELSVAETAIAELRRLAHPREGTPIGLPQRKLRREAARIVAREERRERQARELHEFNRQLDAEECAHLRSLPSVEDTEA